MLSKEDLVSELMDGSTTDASCNGFNERGATRFSWCVVDDQIGYGLKAHRSLAAEGSQWKRLPDRAGGTWTRRVPLHDTNPIRPCRIF
jgi:hypothetical protein